MSSGSRNLCLHAVEKLAGRERATRHACYVLNISCHPLSTTAATAATAPPSHVQIIVKACPAIEQTGQDYKPQAVTGYYADPINHGLIYDNERSPTKEEREAYFATQHCIDVPIPPEVTTSGQVSAEMTMAQCMGHRGYLSAMQFLEMNPAYKSSFPAVGAWQCVEQAFEVSGVAGM